MRAAWGAAAGLLITAAAMAFVVANRDLDGPPGLTPSLPADLLWALAFSAFLLVGGLVASRLPGNPVGWLLLLEGVLLTVSLVASLAAFAFRLRQASPLERRQLKWVAVAVATIAAGLLAAALLDALGVPESVTSYLNTLPLATLTVAIGVAMFRHRLYNVDRAARQRSDRPGRTRLARGCERDRRRRSPRGSPTT